MESGRLDVVTPDGIGSVRVGPLTRSSLTSVLRRLPVEVFDYKETQAKYRIHVVFGPHARTRGLCSGIITYWQIDHTSDMGGDYLVRECPTENCLGMLDKDGTSQGLSYCALCMKLHDVSKIPEFTYFAFFGMEKWGRAVYMGFKRLLQRAEILFSRRRVSVRDITHKIMNKEGGRFEDRLLASHGGIGGPIAAEYVLYTWEALMKDLAAGADPERRFTVLLRGG